ALVGATRETDVIGWYKNQASVGVMFTQLVLLDQQSILSAMLERIGAILRDNLTFEQFNQVSISFHFFPDKWDHDLPQRPSNPTLYPDIGSREKDTRVLAITKRAMDIAGSLLALLIFSPVLLVIASIIKLTSKGPVFF